MAVTVTQGFMRYAFVRQNEGFKKKTINMVNFFLKGDFVCVYVCDCVLLNVCLCICVFVYMCV